MTDPTDDVELIDPDDDPYSEQDVASPARPSSALALLLGLAVVGVLVWLLTRPSPDEEPAPDEAVIEEGVGDTPATTLILPTTRATPSTTQVPGVAVLGEPTGLWLFYGGADNMQRLDMDDGGLAAYGLRAHPLVAMEGELVVASSAASSIGWVSLDNPSEQAEGWKDASIAPDFDRSVIEFLTDVSWTTFEFPSGRILNGSRALAVAPPSTFTGGRPAHLVPGPELVSTVHGIYQRSADNAHQRVRATGEVLHYDDEKALVQECGQDPDVCQTLWLSTVDWTPVTAIEQELPVFTERVLYAEVLGGGAWLHAITATANHLVPLAPLPGAEQLVELTFQPLPESLTVSPDGRWLAVKHDGLAPIDLVDLRTGERIDRYSGFSTPEGGSLLFVSKVGSG